MSFKSKGRKSHPSQNPKVSPEPPKPTPEKESKSPNQKPNQKPKQNQKPTQKPNREKRDVINPPPPDLTKGAKNPITNLISQPSKEPSKPHTNSPLEPIKESKNRITRSSFKPNQQQKGNNKISHPTFKPEQHKGSKNIISRLIFDPKKALPNKNRIRRPKFDPNDVPKNKIIKHKIESKELEHTKNRITRYIIDPKTNQGSKNRIRRHTFKPDKEVKNAIERNPDRPKDIKDIRKPTKTKPVSPPTKITKIKTSKPTTLKQPEIETRKNITKSKWAFLNYDAQGKLISREEKMQHAVKYFNDTILLELRKDPTIARKINTKHTVGSNDLNNKNYSGFLNALSREHKINWSELKSTIGYIKYEPLPTELKENTSLDTKPEPNSEPKYNYNSINYDENNKRLNREQKLEKAIDLFNQKILPELENIPKIKEKLDNGKGVSYRDLEANGFGSFYNAVYKIGVKIGWNEFKQEAGLKINIDQEKYKFLNYDQNNSRISTEEKFNIALEHYQKVIIPDLMKIPEIKQKIEMGNPPAIDDLNDHGHPGFIGPLSQKEPKIQYNTLIEAAGFNPNVDHDKYRFLNYNEQGTPRLYEQKMEIAKDFFNNNIIPKLIEKDLIKPGETPGLREIVKGGFSGFFPSLAFRGDKIDYNELAQAVNLEPNITHGRWDFIKYDHTGNILSKEEKLANATEYFNKTIYPDLVQKGAIRQGGSPTSLDLQNCNHVDFLSALRGKEPKVSFNRFIEYAGFTPHDFNALSPVGSNFHWTAERVFLEHTRSNNCNSFYEVKGNGDNSIIVDENFKNLSNGADLFSQLRPDIRIVNFDYFLGNTEKNKNDHSQRNYQGEGVALCLIPLTANKPQMLENNIPHSRNVFILNPKGFAAFMGYKGEIYEKFVESVELARKAIYDEDTREILYEMRVEAFNAIKSNENDLNYSTKEFKHFLDKQNNPKG